MMAVDPPTPATVPPDSPSFIRELSPARAYAEVVAAIAGVTVLGWFLPLSSGAFGHIYLLAVVALSLRVGRKAALVAAVLSALAWDFVFLPPRLSLAILDFDDVLMLGTYFVTALVGGQLTARIRTLQREREKLLAESEQFHRTLLDSISHELKTPLAVLRGAAERLDTDDAAKRQRVSGEMRTAMRRLDHLVVNLLDQSRLESGTLRPHLDWCDARDLVAAARRNIGEALAGRTLVLEIPDDLPFYRADAALMEHVIGNFLLNAASHTPPDCVIRVTAGLERGSLFIAVSDNGPGLPPEIAAEPFQLFRRGGNARPGGLGLGLSIARGFMVAQGGEVTAGKSPEGGACFTVYLPHVTYENVPDDEQ